MVVGAGSLVSLLNCHWRDAAEPCSVGGTELVPKEEDVDMIVKRSDDEIWGPKYVGKMGVSGIDILL